MSHAAKLLTCLTLTLLPSLSWAADYAVPRSRVARVAYVRTGCNIGYACYSLYGAYGPWGGRAYWASFSPVYGSYSNVVVAKD